MYPLYGTFLCKSPRPCLQLVMSLIAVPLFICLPTTSIRLSAQVPLSMSCMPVWLRVLLSKQDEDGVSGTNSQ